MDVKERYNLWQNDVLLEYNRNTRLVMNKLSRKVMIEKTVSPESLQIHKSLMQCQHPNLVRIYDTADSGSSGTILEEFVNGMTLEYFVQHSKRDIFQTEKVILQICDGLIALHERNIVHRDLTPFNIIIAEDGTAKIADFDIARIPKQNMKRDTQLLGTEGFAAPEQFGFYQSTARTDIYALGILINYMYAGDVPANKPYHGNKALEDIIRQCTEINPDQRFGSAVEVKESLLYAFGRDLPSYQGRSLRGAGFWGALEIMISDLPGLRPNSRMPKWNAVLLYVLASLFIIMTFAAYGKTLYGFLVCAGVVTGCFIIPLFCFSDYLSFQQKLLKQVRPDFRRRLFTVLGWVSLSAGLLLSMAMPR